MEEKFVEDLVKRNKELEEKIKTLQVKNMFCSQIGIEMGTPIAIIAQMVKNALEHIEDKEEVEKSLYKMKENSRVVLDLRNNMLDISDIESGIVKVNKTKFDLKVVLAALANKYQAALKKKFINFYIDINKVKDNLVVGDKEKVEKILECIFEQAIAASPYTGTLCLYVEQILNDSQEIDIRFTFRYTGRKVSPAMCEKFNLTDVEIPTIMKDADMDAFKYMVSNYFLEMLHGSITIETKFEDEIGIFIDLPFGCAKKTSGVLWDRFSQIHTLLLSDKETICEKENVLLNQIGKQCDTALLGEETLEKIKMAAEKGNPYRLCVLKSSSKDNRDIAAFVREIRNIFGNAIYIALITEDTKEFRKKAMGAGVDRILEPKEFQQGFLEILINLEREESRRTNIRQDKDKIFDFEGKCVLVAEDVSLNMELIVNILKRVNMSVLCAENGEEAVRIFESKPSGYFDCILMDVTMPVMDGYEATRRIRNSNREDSELVPIYAMTSNAFAEDIELAKKSGMNGHIAKPIDSIGLYYILEKVFYHEEVLFFEESLKKKPQRQLKKKELQRLADKDILTNTWNRFAFERKMKESRHTKNEIGLLIVDINHFQTINETWGQKIGDEILIFVANRLLSKFSSTDLVVRFGGDEFVVLISKLIPENKEWVLEIIDEINEELMHPQKDFPVMSLSAGLAFSKKGYSKEVYQMADKALYEARRKENKGCIVYQKC